MFQFIWSKSQAIIVDMLLWWYGSVILSIIPNSVVCELTIDSFLDTIQSQETPFLRSQRSCISFQTFSPSKNAFRVANAINYIQYKQIMTSHCFRIRRDTCLAKEGEGRRRRWREIRVKDMYDHYEHLWNLKIINL